MILKLMTSNIWADVFGNPVNIRDAALVSLLSKYGPDAVFLQEAQTALPMSPASGAEIFSFIQNTICPGRQLIRSGIFSGRMSSTLTTSIAP